jgi:methylmalonyl-CoA mutase cobalamin-binding subunit
MKQAVAYLEPKMEKKAGSQKGTIVLATVKGDVHDIGKNLIDIILSNNGYKVVNLGIKQPGDTIIRAAQEHQADAIGLSGLLVKSTLEMKYVIQDLQRQKLEFPVICGGAALTRKYVEDDLRREYSNAVFYADDAFAGLHIMEDLATENGARETRLTEGRTVKEYAKAAAVDEETGPVFAERSPVVGDAPNTPAPPFWGVRVRKDYDLREVFKYINETALFKNQWQLKTASQSDYVRLVEEKFRPIKKQLEEEVIASGWFEPKVVWGYFPAQSDGNDVVVYDPDDQPKATVPTQSKGLLRFTFPRQREGRRLCVSDFSAPKSSGKMDVIGLSLVTAGAGAKHFGYCRASSRGEIFRGLRRTTRLRDSTRETRPRVPHYYKSFTSVRQTCVGNWNITSRSPCGPAYRNSPTVGNTRETLPTGPLPAIVGNRRIRGKRATGAAGCFGVLWRRAIPKLSKRRPPDNVIRASDGNFYGVSEVTQEGESNPQGGLSSKSRPAGSSLCCTLFLPARTTTIPAATRPAFWRKVPTEICMALSLTVEATTAECCSASARRARALKSCISSAPPPTVRTARTQSG